MCGLIWEEFFFVSVDYVLFLSSHLLIIFLCIFHLSTPTGVETPDVIDLRKQQRKEPERPLYQVSQSILLLFFVSLDFWFVLLCNYGFVVFYVGTWREGRKNCSWNFAWNHTHVCNTCIAPTFFYYLSSIIFSLPGCSFVCWVATFFLHSAVMLLALAHRTSQVLKG